MELRKNLLKKASLALAALLLAAGVTWVIKDILAMRNPESALPDIIVRYDTAADEAIIMPDRFVMRVSYAWRFFNTIIKEEVPASQWEKMGYGWMQPNTEMDFRFSYDCRNVHVSVAKISDGMPPEEDDFVAMQLTDTLMITPEENVYYITKDNRLLAPMNPGLYVYRVEADWGFRGSVLYYFKIEVPER